MSDQVPDTDENFAVVIGGIGLAVFLVMGLAVGVVSRAQGGPAWVLVGLGCVALSWGALVGRAMVRAVTPAGEATVVPSAVSRWLVARRA